MPSNLTPRDFRTLAQAVTPLDLDAAALVGSREALPRPGDAPFDIVVVLMMENRSFDHVLGWLAGANGRQAGLSYADARGVVHATYPLAPEWQGCTLRDPDHSWQGTATQYANGRCDGFLKTAPVGDRFPIGYYRKNALPILAPPPTRYTAVDN